MAQNAVEYNAAIMIPRLIATLTLTLALPAAQAYDSAAIPGFIDEMVQKHHFHRDELEQLFQKARYQQSIIDAITAPATLKPWPEYRANFINAARIKAGLKFWQQNERLVKRAEQEFGVPEAVTVALIGVETFYGKQAGKYRVVDALCTLAFDYPPRAAFFRSELEQFLLLAREQEYNLLSVKGSYAGALGISQFMPSSYRKYAVDFNHDGHIDLINERADAIGSAANYLKQFGWVRGEPMAVRASLNTATRPADAKQPRTLAAWAAAGVQADGAGANERMAQLLDFTVPEGKEFWLAFANFGVVKTYNNSDFYAMSVLQLAEALEAARQR